MNCALLLKFKLDFIVQIYCVLLLTYIFVLVVFYNKVS